MSIIYVLVLYQNNLAIKTTGNMTYYHLGEVVHRRAEQYGKKTAIRYQTKMAKGKWKNLSWRKFSDFVLKAAYAMAEMGVQPGDRIGVYSKIWQST